MLDMQNQTETREEESLDSVDFALLRAKLAETLTDSVYPLAIRAEGTEMMQRWLTLYRQILQQPQEYCTLHTHAEDFYSMFHQCLVHYYRNIAEVTMMQEPAFSGERELTAHYYLVKAFIWACLLWHKHEYLAWSILELVMEQQNESLALTLTVALVLTEEPEREIVTPKRLSSNLRRIASHYNMTEVIREHTIVGFLKVLVPPTQEVLHTGITDPQALTPAVSDAFFMTFAHVTSVGEVQSPPEEPADIILDITVTDEEDEQEEDTTDKMAASTVA